MYFNIRSNGGISSAVLLILLNKMKNQPHVECPPISLVEDF